MQNFKIEQYHVVDISHHNLARTLTNTNGKVTIHQQDIRNLDVKGKFNLVIAIEVLMHVPVVDIEKTMENMYRCSNQLIVHLDFTGVVKHNLASHSFIHRYLDLHEKLGGNVISFKPVLSTQTLFTVNKIK